MNIELTKIKVSDLFDGYVDNNEEGVRGYHGLLDIRPAYQREFCYNDKQRAAVIDTIIKGFPLNTMYWVRTNDGTFELLDGQQRTLSICQFMNREFSVEVTDGIPKYFDPEDALGQKILNYELMVYVCDGEPSERLDWFRTINIAGEELTDQELLNINYIGSWLTDAKRKFSKTGCIAYKCANKYIKGSPIRQEYLETAIRWISNDNISSYMAEHQQDVNANELWLYFNGVIEWVKTTFGENNYRKEMCGIDWGLLYRKYHNNIYDAKHMEERVNELMSNEEVTDKKGVYEYVLSGEDKELARKLSKRQFSERDKRTVYERQKGICAITGEHYPIEEMEADHIIPWWNGGITTIDNLQMVWKHANRLKGGNI